jgi:DNA-binding NtrC family response regulator/predicted Ser/Thr protein kinase
MTPRILVIDDDPAMLAIVGAALESAGLTCTRTNRYADGARALEGGWDLVISDLFLDNGHTGLEILDLAKSRTGAPPVILMTGAAEVETAVQALKQGAFEYLPKPLNLRLLLSTVNSALRRKDESRPGPLPGVGPTPRLVGRTPAMVALYVSIGRAAMVGSPCLIVGEEGVGKELVAREIHRQGPAASKTFVALTCAHSNDDFLGPLADPAIGTLLLRQVLDLSEPLQARLARRLDSDEPGPRVIATARSLAFDPALRELLSVVRLDPPPLRDRLDDLPLLIEAIGARLAPRLRRALRVTGAGLDALRARSWPGNVRQLAHVLESAAIASPTGTIDADDIRRAAGERTAAAAPVAESVSEPERLACVKCGTPYTRAEAESTSGTCTRCGPQAILLPPEPTIARDLAEAPKFAGSRYIPYKLIARSTFSEVWLGWQPALSRKVIVKLLVGEGGQEAARFHREARVQASLKHPNIPTAYEVGTDALLGGRLFLVTEYIEGTSLDEYSDSLLGEIEEPERIHRILRLVAQSARALDYMHSKGYIHRDVKPSNIVVTPDERAYLIDYGLARSMTMSDSLTSVGTVMGTMPFMAPEQVRGTPEELDGRTDIWGLGASLYFLFTCRYAFHGGTFEEVSDHIQMSMPEPPRTHNPAIPEGVNRLILRCLSKLPERRHPRAGDLAQAIEAEIE